MQTITEDEVMGFWRYQMSTAEITRVLKNLFKRSSKAKITQSQGSWIYLEESSLSEVDLECLKSLFFTEDFVILEYRSWIIDSLGGPKNPDLERRFLDFWLENVRTNNVRDENGKYIFNYADSRQIKNYRAKKFATECPWDATAGMDIIAAFSESKIWIGWSPDIDHPQLAGIVISTKSVDAPCFSWSKNDPDNPPANNCLSPWPTSRYWGKLDYRTKNTSALFRELIVRCKGDYEFLEMSSVK